MPVDPPTLVEAELLVRELRSGRNRGVIITARGPGGPVDCVVKLAARLTVPPLEYLFEWVAAAIGRALGVSVPEPFGVRISPEFAASIRDDALRPIVQRSCTLSFGCRFLPGPVTQWIPALADHPEHRQVASELLAFDVFIHNPDRRADNPNILLHRDELYAIDHDAAFAFCFPPLLSDPTVDPLRGVVEKHAVGQALKGTLGNLKDFRDGLCELSDAWFEDLRAATPPAWTVGHATEMLGKIIDVLRLRRNRVDEWLAQVQAGLE